MRVETNRDEQTILRDLLRLLASGTDVEYAAATVLSTAQTLTDAVGGYFQLFEPLAVSVAVGKAADWNFSTDLLRQSVGDGQSSYRVNPTGMTTMDTTTLALPVRVNGQVVAGWWLLYAHDFQPTDNDQRLLGALTDGLSAAVQIHKNNEQASLRLARLLVNAIHDPIIVLNAQKAVLLVNTAAEEALGIAHEQATGKMFGSLVADTALLALVENGTPLPEWEPEEGKSFAPRIQPLDGGHGWVLALRDISRFKKLNLNQSEFMRIVSHDLRSPLTSMQGFASMLESGMVGDLNEKQVHFVEKILAGITQITALVDNIQDAGRFDPETGFYEMSRSHCDLGALVKQVTNNHLLPAEKQELTVTVEVADDVPIVNVDANMLERAVTNLVDNAIKYTPNRGRIQVAVRKTDSQIIISVKDSGYGISPEQQKLLFQRHRRLARQEHIRVKGSGLGLFIVRSVARRHGGEAWVESVEKQGSTFFISVPLSGENLIIAEV